MCWKRTHCIVVAVFVICCSFFGCKHEPKTTKPQPKQLNITVLLDLSDRISPTIHPATPEHAERDKAIMQELITIFKKEMEDIGRYNAKGKFQVLMEPAPKIANIENLQKELVVDCSQMKDVQQKKELYDNMENIFKSVVE